MSPAVPRRSFLSMAALAGVTIVSSVALSGCTTFPRAFRSAAAGCAPRRASEVVPDTGSLFGVNLDWGRQTLEEYATLLGHRPAVAVVFADVPLGAQDVEDVRGAADQVRGQGGTLLLTLEPQDGLQSVTDDVADDVAALVNEIQESGVPVIVRFAHEMNGSWYPWGQQPDAYVGAFRRVARALRSGAPGSATMWAPNEGGGYPFHGGPAAAVAGTLAFEVLDTDGDGALTARDDPYTPYYPGDDVVDWVGLSIYHWGAAAPWGANVLPEEGKFAAKLTGTYNGAGGDETPVPDFYDLFGVRRNKPVAVPETAALVVPRGDPEGERAIKQAWWSQVFSAETASRFPNVRMINWFEWDKYETEVQEHVDWTVLHDPATRAAFIGGLPGWLHFAEAPQSCRTAEPGR
ncbi:MULTISPECIES: glycoside hydrolase family 26 protein [unclassified Curtobacterium]|uniref:glycoside hydrolase family 26 protein n=1 Tax=unclassified Curtobacterium TaxID=257496 RepID=UPI0021AC24C3|nr:MULTISPECIES: glycosyl hydrolase [unclassified Curtobacterium]